LLWRDLMQSSDNLTAQISNLLTIELQSWFLMMSCRSHAIVHKFIIYCLGFKPSILSWWALDMKNHLVAIKIEDRKTV
jgi:hypothetical protein